MNYDVIQISNRLQVLPKFYNGMSCILELKQANYNWKQLEWLGFYFEYKSKNILSNFNIGDTFGNVTFDFKVSFNWDLKASSNSTTTVILNDKVGMDHSLKKYGSHGEVIARFDVEYDNDGSFKEWHSNLKGGKSKYELKREIRTDKSRLRKVKAELSSIYFIVIEKTDNLLIMNQGINSNGKSRRPKYSFDIKKIDNFDHYKLQF